MYGFVVRLVALVALSPAIVACATIKPSVSIEQFGVVDPVANQSLAHEADEMEATPDDVQVVQGRLPKGLALSDDNKTVHVSSGFEEAYEVVGVVEADFLDPSPGELVLRNMFWTFDYDETWRKALCYPQVPLKILTLSMWAIVPIHYPCYAVYPDEEERKIALVDALKRGAGVLGANLIVLTSTGSLQVVSGNQNGIMTSIHKDMSISGIAIKVKERDPKPGREVLSL